MNKLSFFLILAAMVFAISSCKNNNKPEELPVHESDTVAAEVPDSTVYGVLEESGMSTLYLRTGNGSTIVLDRTGEDGSYSEIYGYVAEGDSFAVTMKGDSINGYTLTRAYNLSLIDRFALDYSIRNGLFVLGGKDTVAIQSLNDDSLVVKYASAQIKAFPSRNK